MSRRSIAFLTGLATAAAGAWWWWRQRTPGDTGGDRGTVIYSNTPPANPVPGIL